MEGNRDVEMAGSVVRAWKQVEREKTEETEKERRIRRIHPRRCKYDQRGHANIDNLYAEPSNLRRDIDQIENQTYEFDIDAMRIASTTKNT